MSKPSVRDVSMVLVVSKVFIVSKDDKFELLLESLVIGCVKDIFEMEKVKQKNNIFMDWKYSFKKLDIMINHQMD
ncbi:MAG: hypothetical protein N2450_03325 [bacterium]|nr:hypothetical protein [bacterium]